MSDDEDREGDPFEHLDDEDREGDPFEHLTPSSDDVPTPEETDVSPDVDAASPDERRLDDDPFAEESEGLRSDDGGPSADEPDDDSRERAHEALPSQDDAEIDEEAILDRIDGVEEDPFDASASTFEHVDVGDVDPDEVWERIHDAREEGSLADAGERVERVVSKHEYCQQCEYFSSPPDIACSHEGTDIVEFPDMEHVLVVDCPVVAEREELEQLSE